MRNSTRGRLGALAGAVLLSLVTVAVFGAPAGAQTRRQPSATYTQMGGFQYGSASAVCDGPGVPGGQATDAPIVAAALTSDDQGCWVAGADGGVFSYGNAHFHGSLPGLHITPAAPVVGMAATGSDGGYWLVASDGGIFSFGNAAFHGSMGVKHLNAPVVGMAADTTTGGYWEVAADGGVFSFDAPFYGSMGGKHLDAPIVGMATAPTAKGYWLVASNGGVFSFGSARFHGSLGGKQLETPVVGMALDRATGGYWLAAADGGVFSFDAPFYGSHPGFGPTPLPDPVTAIVATASGTGYFLLATDLAVEPGVPGRSGYDLARRAWVDDGNLDCADQSEPLFQGGQYLLIGEREDGGTTSGYTPASDELVQESELPGMTRTPTETAEATYDAAALNAFFGSDYVGTCG